MNRLYMIRKRYLDGLKKQYYRIRNYSTKINLEIL
nr:MAG TPA: hypothetical protein [Bacteriophage sp.]